MNLPAISFDDIKSRRRGVLEFPSYPCRDFPAVKTGRDPDTGKVYPKLEVFRDHLFKRIEEANGLAVERVVANFLRTGKDRRLRCIAYQTGRQVLLVTLDIVGNLRLWIDAFRKLLRASEGRFFLTRALTYLKRDLEGEFAVLAENPIKLIKLFVPDEFNLAGLKREKLKFFKNFEQIPGPAEPLASERLEALLDAFLAARGVTTTVPDPTAVDAWATRLEQHVGAALPGAFKALYRRLDGARRLFFGHDLLSMADIEREWAGWHAIFEAWNLRDLRGSHTGERGVTHAIYCCPRWIPFVDLVGGNFLALDLAPGPRGHLGQIIVYGADVEKIRCIASDLPRFLKLCLDYDGRPAHPLHDVFAELALY